MEDSQSSVLLSCACLLPSSPPKRLLVEGVGWVGLDTPSKHISGSCSAYRSLHTCTHGHMQATVKMNEDLHTADTACVPHQVHPRTLGPSSLVARPWALHSTSFLTSPSLLPTPTLTSHSHPSPHPHPSPSPILLVKSYHLNFLVVWESEHPPHFRHTGR